MRNRNTKLVPPLKHGDRLTREEFERRYDASTNLKVGELIEGQVYLQLRVPWLEHAAPHADLISWLASYHGYTPYVQVGVNSSIRLDRQNEPQPDVAMILEPALGGLTKISSDGYLV